MMKLTTIQIVSGVFLTAVGAITAMVMKIETPPHKGESWAILTVGVTNLLWLVPSIIYIRRKQLQGATLKSAIIFCAFWLPFVALRMHDPAFRSEEWKTSLDEGKTAYDGTPSHWSGGMVASIVQSDTLIGKTLPEIESLLGVHHFKEDLYGDSSFFYLYTNWNPFDGCDKLAIKMRDGLCVGASYFGCD